MTKQELHRILDQIPDALMPYTARVLEALRDMGDPLNRLLDSVPEEDEPLSARGLGLLQEGLDELDRGEALSHEEVLRQVAEWEGKGK